MSRLKNDWSVWETSVCSLTETGLGIWENHTHIHKVGPISLSLPHKHTGTQCTWSLSLSPHGCSDTPQVSDSRVQQKQQCVCECVSVQLYTALCKACTAMSINCETMRNQTERAKIESTVWWVYHPMSQDWASSKCHDPIQTPPITSYGYAVV